MNKTKKTAALFAFNWRTLVSFELMYKFISMAIAAPLFWSLFNGILDITGYHYLTAENTVRFLRDPVTIAALLLLFILITVYSLVDISAILFIMDQSRQKRKTSLFWTAKFALKNAARAFQRKNRMFVLIILLFIPFLNIGSASTFVGTIAVPGFMQEYISKRWYLSLTLVAAAIIMGALLVRWIYAFHYFTLENCDFKAARKKSAVLGRRRHFRDLLFLLSIQAVCSLLSLIFIWIGIFLVFVIQHLLVRWELLEYITISAVVVVLAVTFIVMVALEAPLCYGCISVLFYMHKESEGEAVIELKTSPFAETPKMKKRILITETLLLLTAVASFGIYANMMIRGETNLPVEYLWTMEVTAHRGASALYPENTMAAFEGAWELGADWVELDVQQSRDGQIFVLHDNNFKRTAGVNRNTWELTYAEISRLGAGRWFSKEFEGERIPLLSEVIEWAKEKNMRLNIELKPTGHETEFEKCVVDIIQQEEFEGQCVITSQAYYVLEKVKELEEDIPTVYVMSLAYGKINRLTAADAFSIEAGSATETMVSRIHNAGKQIYVWTVNSKRKIQRMLHLNVDNIITDDITLAKESIYESKTSDLISGYIEMLSEW